MEPPSSFWEFPKTEDKTKASLLDFPVKGVALQKGIVLLFFEALWLVLEVLFGRIARRRFALFTGLGALQRNDSHSAFFLRHSFGPHNPDGSGGFQF